jgi:pyrrolysine biosynthesis protein PylC
VAGGGLQGSEAAYLASKAGWSTTLIDRMESVPASGLCDHFVRLDLLAEGMSLERLLEQADFVVPALENQAALNRLEQAAGHVGVPLSHDAAAYAITVSKQMSDALFAARGIPAPRYWPDCSLSVIAKPSESSGSRGVRLLAQPAAGACKACRVPEWKLAKYSATLFSQHYGSDLETEENKN